MLLPLVLALATSNAPAAPNCSRQASVLHAVAPVYPDSEVNAGRGVESALIKITLDAGGKVVKTSVYQSTGSAAFDRAALDAASASSYQAGEVDCRPVGGTFLYHAVFAPRGAALSNGKTDPCNHAAAVTQILAPNSAGYTFTKPFPLKATIAVNVDATGQPQTASIVSSSGDAAFDSLMYAVAAKASYVPAMLDCKAAAGTALLSFGLVRK
ncbi:MAG TPA: TonB family protein [Candidatus Baltobacteraceae bacterium]